MAAISRDPGSREIKPARLWPGIVLVCAQWLVRFGVPVIWPEATPIAILSGLGGGVLVVLWWAFFSRVPAWMRWGGIGLGALGMILIRPVLHASIATGMMGLMPLIYGVPLLSMAYLLWAIAVRSLSPSQARWLGPALVVIACASLAFVRTAGMTGAADSDFKWRWSATAEEELLASQEPLAESPVSAPTVDADWPGFRGSRRDGRVDGSGIRTDWGTSPPVELWRRSVGPGWSSFAVQGDLIYTQEQRGDEEVVSCYRLSTGEPVWRHTDRTRFWESNGGAGPRATPSLHAGRLYALGGTGVLNALDAVSGDLIWSRETVADAEVDVPTWGISGSPWVDDAMVIVAVSGRLVAYVRESGEPLWLGPDGGVSYSSPQPYTSAGVDQILLLSETGAVALAPSDGSLLWDYSWKGYPIVQPGVSANGDLLVSVTDKSGIRRLTPAREGSGWSVQQRWTSLGLKPYFNDFVVHHDHAYGFDGRILACIDLSDGSRVWKGGRYGSGQMILLADQDLLLVLSERGEMALVDASPAGFEERARVPAIDGKTWNHPVLVGDVVLLRNAHEMAAFRLASRNPE